MSKHFLSVLVFIIVTFGFGVEFAASQSLLAWEKNHPERAVWSAELRREFRAVYNKFDKARDLPSYCAHYSILTPRQKVETLATLAVAIARPESGYDPKRHYREPPPLNYDSVGLFQLSYEDGFSWCVLNRPSKSLENPINNIRCTVPEMARLVSADSEIAAGKDSKDARGLARYWSVIRKGPKHFLAQIQASTQSLKFCR